MCMDVRICSVKANIKQVIMGLCNDNTKRPKPRDTQLGSQKFMHFAGIHP